MTRTRNFRTPESLASFFNRPENHDLKLFSATYAPVGNAPPWVAFYGEPGPAPSAIEEKRRGILVKKIEDAWNMDRDDKIRYNFPQPILEMDVVPFSWVNNRLRDMVAFRDMTHAARHAWVRENLNHAQCRYVSKDDAERDYSTLAELIVMEG